MAARFDRALWLAQQLTDATDLRAVVDVADALGNLPCVLIPPPRIDYTAKLIEWRLVVLGAGAGAFGWESIDDQLTILFDELPLERAEPGVYQLPNGDPSGVACYIAVYAETL